MVQDRCVAGGYAGRMCGRVRIRLYLRSRFQTVSNSWTQDGSPSLCDQRFEGLQPLMARLFGTANLRSHLFLLDMEHGMITAHSPTLKDAVAAE